MWKFNLWNWGNAHWLRAPDGEGAGGGGGGSGDGGNGGGNGAGDGGDGKGAGAGNGAGGGAGDGNGGGDGSGKPGDGAGAGDGKPPAPGILDLAGKGAGQGQGEGQGQDGKGAPPAKAPDWVPAQYRNADGTLNAEAAARAAVDLRAELAKKPGRPPDKPEGYKLEITSDALKAEGMTKFDTADPVFGVFTKAAHKAGLSNDQANMIANAVMEFAASQGEGIDPAVAVQAEFKKLGPNAQSIVDGLNGWGEHLQSIGVLSKEELQEYRFMAGTALGASVMLKLREQAGEKPLPRGNIVTAGAVSGEDAYAMMAAKDDKGVVKYGNDPEWTKKVDAAFAAAFGNEPAGSSPAGLGVRPGA